MAVAAMLPLFSAGQSAAGAGFQIGSAIGNIWLQKVNRDIQKRQLERQLQRATEVSLRNTEASADQIAEIGKQKMREQLGIATQKATAKGAARVQAAKTGGSAIPALEEVEFTTGQAQLNLDLQADNAVADVMTQARTAVESIRDQLFSMDMSIDPYDILGPVSQIGSAVFDFQKDMTQAGKNAYGQDINPGQSFWTPKG